MPEQQVTFREAQEADVQSLVLEPQRTQAIQEQTRDRLAERFYKLHANDPPFAEYREARLEVAVSAGAVNALIGTEAVRRVASSGDVFASDGVEAYVAATEGYYQAAAEAVFQTQCNAQGPYALLREYAGQATARLLSALEGMDGREWEMRGVARLNEPDVEKRIKNSWKDNSALTASLFILKAIGVCLEMGSLPAASHLKEIAAASIEDLEVITTTKRTVFGLVIGGQEAYGRVLKQLRARGSIDGRYTLWLQGIIDCMEGTQAGCPFAGRTTDSPLISGTAAEHRLLEDGKWDDAGACSGQFTCRAVSDEDNSLARTLFADLGVPIREDGGFSPFRLQGGLAARALGETIFKNPAGRAALVAASEFVQRSRG